MDEFKSGFLTIVGLPNVGKSTLLNNLIGSKVSIVTSKPQTTRDNIKAILTNEKMQLVFIDTPGLHRGKDLLGKRMSRHIGEAIDGVDLILLLVDATVETGTEEKFILRWLSSKVQMPDKEEVKPVFLLLNKVDIIEDKSKILNLITYYKDKFPFAEIIPLSALKGDNCDVLLKEIYKILSPGPAYYPPEDIIDQEEDFIVSELIREQILLVTHQEVPYSVAVRVTEMTEKKEGKLLFISAIIYVEKESQKGILIGKKGSMLKNIGSMARESIEKTLKTKVFLELKVKVKKNGAAVRKYLKTGDIDSEQ